MAHKVLIPQDVSDTGKQYLRERGYEIKMGSGISVEQLKADVQDCDAILARTAKYPAEVLEAAPKLKVIGRHGVGYDNIAVDKATELGIYVTNAPESNANSVAEHTIGLIIASAHYFTKCDKELRKGNWEVRNQVKGYDIEGKTLGIIGLGKIGRRVAKKAKLGLEMKIIGYDPYISKENKPEHVDEMVEWEDIFKNSDFVTLHMPSTPETKGMIGEKELSLMNPESFFINAARGDVVDEKALIKILKEEKIAGAGLDVFAEEPLPADSPLMELDKLILLPHNAALTKECTGRMSLHAAMGIDEVLSGKEPTWPVNKPKNRRS